MWKCASPNSRSIQLPRPRAGLTLVEVVVSTLIVGLMTVAALNGLGATTRSSELAGKRAVAQGMADELMTEILATAYSEPSGAATIGLDAGEAAPRSNFDDVDDFDGWNQRPPQAADGSTLSQRSQYRQIVTVQRVVPSNPTQATPGAAEQGAKRICVTIECDDVVLAEQSAVVTDTDN